MKNGAKANAIPSLELKKKRTFRKFSYRGIDLDQYVFLSPLPYSPPPTTPPTSIPSTPPS